jgi:hypothetical protein
MKTLFKLSALSILVSAFIFSCSKDNLGDDNQTLPILSTLELEMMHYMMEEEKLALDVYQKFYELYGSPVFTNISKSEQSHIDAVNKLLNKYNITNTASTVPGIFKDAHLQELYNSLIASGNQSLLNAFIVGATIEDVDIYDLENYMEETQNADIISVFEFLNCGSRNHLRSFMGQITLQNSSYVPQFITEDRFDEILDDSRESCGTVNL